MRARRGIRILLWTVLVIVVAAAPESRYCLPCRRRSKAVSRRGQGKPNDTNISDMPANFAGDFSLGRETLRFSRLQFVIPGAMAQMKGSYGLHSQAVNFRGNVRLEATVSRTMKGSKRWLLVPFDPIFMRHGAGTYLPVAITGTRGHPEVKLQWKELF